jgi:hypothetical protein
VPVSGSANERDVLVRMLRRRPIPADQHETALLWVGRSRSWLGRITSPELISTLIGASLVTYILSGRIVFGIVAVALVPLVAVALAVWGSVRAWARSGRLPSGPPARRLIGRVPRNVTPPPPPPTTNWQALVAPAAAIAAFWIVPELVFRVARRSRAKRAR